MIQNIVVCEWNILCNIINEWIQFDKNTHIHYYIDTKKNRYQKINKI
jgi:hypothetical protein